MYSLESEGKANSKNGGEAGFRYSLCGGCLERVVFGNLVVGSWRTGGRYFYTLFERMGMGVYGVEIWYELRSEYKTKRVRWKYLGAFEWPTFSFCLFFHRLDFRPELGRYDLLISNASYERDNGKFECRLKAPGSGRDLHSQSFLVTVLTQPGPPRISPSPNPTATEGKAFELTCSSSGGSPEPVIRWVSIVLLGSSKGSLVWWRYRFHYEVANILMYDFISEVVLVGGGGGVMRR